jgi:neutral ceramidase
MEKISAGVGRVTITPPVGIYLIGMERYDDSHGLRDDLYATALALSDGNTETVLVSLDVLSVHPELVRRVAELVEAQMHIPAQNLLLCATHCHSGPATYAYPDSPLLNIAYVDNLVHLLVGLVRIAHDRRVPARLGFGRGKSNIGVNRRLTRPDGVTVIDANPTGPTDPEVGILRVDDSSGNPLAVLVNYACHPVVLGGGSNVISSDWPGAMRRKIESAVGGKVLYLQGAGADINPQPGQPTDREDILEQLGAEIGDEVLRVFNGITTAPTEKLAVASRKIWLPLLPVSQHAGRLPELVELGGAVTGLSYDQLQIWLHQRSPWSAELQGQGDNQAAAMEMHALRAGDIALVTAGGEIFSKTGLAVKRRSPFSQTLFAGYTNGKVGYIPLTEEYSRGGYEVNEAYLGARLPAPFAPRASVLVEQNALDLLKEIQ